MARFYVDEEGNRYAVDRETGERTLIEPAQSEGASTSGPVETAGEQED